LTIIHPSQHLTPKEITMFNRIVQRALSLFLSAMFTVAMLGGIDHLAIPDAPAAGMADHAVNTPRA